MSVMLPRGLATAALCTLPVGLGIAGTESFPDIGFVVILTTTMLSVAGTVVLKRNRNVPWSPSEHLEEESVVEAAIEIGLTIEGVRGVFILYRGHVGLGGEVPTIIRVTPDDGEPVSKEAT